MIDTPHKPKTTQTIDGAGRESEVPQSGEPSGRSLRDGLSAAPSPVFITVENAGKAFAVIVIGFMCGIFVFLLWALSTKRR